MRQTSPPAATCSAQRAAAQALSGLSRAFADAWDSRHDIEGPRQHIARDTVRDVEHGMSPRSALLLNGFALNPTEPPSADVSDPATTMNPPAQFGERP